MIKKMDAFKIFNNKYCSLLKKKYPYLISDIYPDYDDVCETFAIAQFVINFLIKHGADVPFNIKRNAFVTSRVEKMHLPIYCLTNDIIDAFIKTDLIQYNNYIFKNFKTLLPGFLLLLPNNTIKNVKYIIVSAGYNDMLSPHFDRKHFIDNSDDYNYYHVIGRGDDHDSHSVFDINPTTGVIDGFSLSTNLTEDDNISINLMVSIVLQFLLVYQYKPELILPEQPPKKMRKVGSKGFKTVKKIFPRYVDINPIKKVAKSDDEFELDDNNYDKREYNHTMKQWWRRGHWRTQPVGKDRLESKVIWIKPSLVTASSLSKNED